VPGGVARIGDAHDEVLCSMTIRCGIPEGVSERAAGDRRPRLQRWIS
jgi:hypothetical protein